MHKYKVSPFLYAKYWIVSFKVVIQVDRPMQGTFHAQTKAFKNYKGNNSDITDP